MISLCNIKYLKYSDDEEVQRIIVEAEKVPFENGGADKGNMINYLKYSDDEEVQRVIEAAEKLSFDDAIRKFDFNGVYAIICDINGMVYIGHCIRQAQTQKYTKGMGARLREHNNKLNKKTHDNYYLTKNWHRYTKENFHCFLIKQCDGEDAVVVEDYFIKRIFKQTKYNQKEARKILQLTEKDKERFWSKIDIKKEDGCWEWQNSIINGGYGDFRIGQKMYRSHRIAYFLEYGILSSYMLIMHVCDNKKCCNPRHLVIGTNLQNQQDYQNKNPKFTEKQIIEIWQQKQNGKSYEQISKDYSVSCNTIRRHLTGQYKSTRHFLPTIISSTTKVQIIWSSYEIQLLENNLDKPTKELAQELGRTMSSIQNKKYHLRVLSQKKQLK